MLGNAPVYLFSNVGVAETVFIDDEPTCDDGASDRGVRNVCDLILWYRKFSRGLINLC
jgi:hypothetical protein